MTNFRIIVILVIVEKGELMKESLEKIEEQHLQNYRAALFDTIQDNTDKLVQEDFLLLLKEPPLASMDILKSKILSRAIEDGIILSTEQLTKVVQQFRDKMISELPEIGLFRKKTIQESLDKIIKSKEFTKEEVTNILKNTKEELKSLFGVKLEHHIQEEMIPLVPALVDQTKNSVTDKNDSFFQNASEYLTYRYPTYIEESLESRITLKDQTLLNRLLEHQERYRFTKEHSHLFQEKIKK